MEYVVVNASSFNEICRVCMKNSDNFLSISELKIIDMMISCTSVHIEQNDDLPKQICNACYNQLENAFNFKQLCEHSDNTFRQIIEQCQVIKIEVEENENVKLEDNEHENIKLEGKEFENNEIIIKPEIVQEFEDEEEFQCVNKTSSTIENFVTKSLDNPITVQNLSNNCEYNVFNSHFMDTNEKEKTVGNQYQNENTKIKDNQYVCELCNSKFDKVWYLGYHMRRAHGATGIRCSHCALVCYHPLHLITHVNSHVPPTPSVKQKYKCDTCKQLFNTVIQLTKHQRTHKKSYPCRVCDDKFDNKPALNLHTKILHNVLNREENQSYYQCTICNEEFEYKASLNLHVQVIHLNKESIQKEATPKAKKWFKCCDCSRKFSKHIHLRKHMKKDHSNWNRRETS
ncbi:RB-associated KRAB zinc finger protein-like [Chrysoperla carnea]|uniref:RB-associated KRAB zinc finger protein-like n=1 Tax=Chrysoperla carnea TaxID=189513 RepID=UPI001D068441|nr:RB-associated KRAB zinc finger protein-like [Chrysoperla carnea]